MASGRIEIPSTVLTDIDLGLDWVETPNAANNTSTVAITSCQLKSPTYGGYWYPNGTIKINGQTVVSMDYTVATHRFYLHANNSWVDIIKWKGGSTAPPWSTGAIAHNADGSKSVTIEVNLEMWQSDPMPKPKFTVSKTVTLDKINTGLIYIDNGSGWTAYKVYIDNGSAWAQYTPYIDTGSGWVKY